jgi:hypothetical protein
MTRRSYGARLRAPLMALAVGASLALTGCGGSGTSSGGSGGSPGGVAAGAGNSAPCAAFSADYKKFLAGNVASASQTGINEPLLALSGAVDKINSSGQLQQDLAQLGIDAGLIATGETQGGFTTPPSAFDADLQAVGKDCGTTFTNPPAALIREG